MRALVLAFLTALVLVGTATGAARDVKLSLVAYSTPKDVYGKIIPAFQKTGAGKGVSFDQSYAGSGEQSRAVENGLSADVVAFSLEPDILRLVGDGLVSKRWNGDRYHGMVTDSVVVFLVRKGNPKKIKTWNDLVKANVEVITPNPFISGGARWNVMAAYGAQRKAGKTDKQAIAFLTKLFKNVSVQDKSARESLQTFASGKGDVLLAYENEAILAQRKNVSAEYVVPRQTILIENPVAVISKSKHLKEAKAFVTFLRSAEAQQIFGEQGYRPVVKSALRKFKYPQPRGLFTIKQLGLGGWKTVQKRFFDRQSGIMVKVERQARG